MKGLQSISSASTRAPKAFDKEQTKAKLAGLLEELDELQNLLYAGKSKAVLVILQGLDASGKDGLTKDVFGSMNPQGVHVSSFKVPTEEERAHDFLWRIHKACPAKGMIAVFNRSQYEDVLVNVTNGSISESTARRRMETINAFERHLKEEGTVILKCYLHVSEAKQRERVAERQTDPRKMWKWSPDDLRDIDRREQFLATYETIFEQCSEQPWTIVPADQKWYRNYLVAKALRDLLKSLGLQYPQLPAGAPLNL